MAKKLNNHSGYRAQEVCDLLGISKKTLFKWEDEGYIPAIGRDWRHWRVYSETDIGDIRRFMSQRTQQLRTLHLQQKQAWEIAK